MAHPDHQHDEFPLLNLVHDPILADPDSPQSAQLTLQGDPRERVPGEAIDRLGDGLRRARAGFAIRASSLAALPLILTE